MRLQYAGIDFSLTFFQAVKVCFAAFLVMTEEGILVDDVRFGRNCLVNDDVAVSVILDAFLLLCQLSYSPQY